LSSVFLEFFPGIQITSLHQNVFSFLLVQKVLLSFASSRVVQSQFFRHQKLLIEFVRIIKIFCITAERK
jgi:uncharacterized membrane protein YedE/YeeE